MPPVERDGTRSADKHLRHQHSASSDQGRSIVPMWDSSDPERAPPPLPLNPQSPSTSTSRAGTSSAIQSAHAALTEKARESALVSNALARRMVADVSPEKPLSLRSAASPHKRMQSLQTGSSVRDLSHLLDGGAQHGPAPPPTPSQRSPERLSTRPSTPVRGRDIEKDPKSLERERRSATPTPSGNLTPIVRPSMRRPPQSILGENTPPQSATMLALQNMATSSTPREVESPLANITNGSAAVVRAPQPIEALSVQILSLTNIATALQKEMSQLSRRSRDNATDLMSLKEATGARDEDIRKSLREIIHNASEAAARARERDPYGGGLFLDNKPHNSSPSMSKAVRPFSLPRIPSPNSFAASIDRESMSTPSLYGPDTSAALALLDKIIREMGTKDAQELLLNRLDEVAQKLNGTIAPERFDELLREVRAANQEQAVVPATGGGGNRGGGPRSRTFSFDEPHQFELGYNPRAGPMTQRVEKLLQQRVNRRESAPPQPSAADVINDDILKIIKTVKDSVAQGGGLTAEVKALVRELRGEVLGMGREIGRRLDEVSAKTGNDDAETTKQDVARVVEEGLEQLKHHMDELLREHRRQSAASVASRSSAVDYKEIYNAMRAALKDSHVNRPQQADLGRDDIIEAVREAWENYKPEIEVQQIGLEREEVLACLKEGLQEYTPRDRHHMGATREEVFKAVVEGLKHFVPPKMESSASLSRNEILEAVRECLEEFEFPIAPSALGGEITREEMADAVKEGLRSFEFPQSNSLVPHVNNEEVVSRLGELSEALRAGFEAVSQEAKQNIAANGGDTEQLLDATKDGFEKLRTDIEAHLSRSAGVGSQAGVLETLASTLDEFRDTITDLVSKVPETSKDAIKDEIEALREAVNSSIVPAPAASVNHKEILDALKEGMNSLRAEIAYPSRANSEILDALHEGLGDIRASMDKIVNKPADLTANDEVMDALKAGLDGVRSEIDSLREENKSDRAVTTVGDSAIVSTEILKSEDIKNLEALIMQLRVKVEAMDPPQQNEQPVSKEDLGNLEEMLRSVQESVSGIGGCEGTTNADGSVRDDVQAIETILRNTKARLDDLIDGEQAVRKEHIDALETLILETRDRLVSAMASLEQLSKREDISTVEALIGQLAAGLDEMKDQADKQLEDPDRVTKTDVEALETVCLEVKASLEQVIKADLANLPSKDDFKTLGILVREYKDHMDAHAETNAKAFEDRQAETVGVGERVSEVKAFLEEFRDTVKKTLEDGATGIDSLGKLLENLGETIGQNANVGRDLGEMFDTMKAEFEESKAGVVGAKLESDDKFQQTTETLSAKIDDRIGELILRYDDFQASMDEKMKLGEARDVTTEAAVIGTKAVSEELKSLIDTLGSAVTDSLERMEEASKTVFNRVEDLLKSSDMHHSDDKAEHQLTRDHIKQAISVVEGVQGHVCEYQPKILDAVNDILMAVSQHYEYSKTSATDIQEKIEEAKTPETPMLPPPEKYDDSEVQQKLDKLVDHIHASGKALAQLETLDKVHKLALQTSSEVADIKAGQTKRLNDEQEEMEHNIRDKEALLRDKDTLIQDKEAILRDKEATLQETNIAIERGLERKECLEKSVRDLKDEEARTKESIRTLRADQESLARQKLRLAADVSSLETALRLRREELHDMEARAEGLERRILEGVMDHSRILIMSKAAASKPGRDIMSRKRVPQSKPGTGTDTAPLTGGTASRPRAGVNMALASNQSLLHPAQSSPGSSSRRILSLSQISNNTPASPFKRSQSVRHPTGAPTGLRKGSWGGSGHPSSSARGSGFGVAVAGADDKENATLKESDEEDQDHARRRHSRSIERTSREASHSELGVAEDADIVDETEDDGDRSTLRRSSSRATSRTRTSVGTRTETDGGHTADYSEDDELRSDWGGSTVSRSTGPAHGNEMVLFDQ